MSGGWKKWECPPDMLTVEEKLKTLQLTERQLEEISMAYYEYEMKKAKTPEQKVAWANLLVRKKSKLIKGNLQEGMVEDFQLWLQGRSKYNVKEVEEVKFNPISNKFEKMKRECTPWGNKSLLHLGDVCEWLKLPTMNRDKVAKSISILKMTTPTNIDEAWIYYKYITRGIAIDGQVLKEQRYANVFDYIEKPPMIVERDPDTGDELLVQDPNFKPYSMNNQSMPKFDEKTYQQNFDHFNNQLAKGNMHAIIDENDRFSSLTPDDKLVLLIKAVAMEEAKEHLPPSLLASVPVPAGSPEDLTARVDAAPYFLSELANTIGAAVGKGLQNATTEQQKNMTTVMEILKKVQEDNLAVYRGQNQVLLDEFAKITTGFAEIREIANQGNQVAVNSIREISDRFKVIGTLLERDAERANLASLTFNKPLPPVPKRNEAPAPPAPTPIVTPLEEGIKVFEALPPTATDGEQLAMQVETPEDAPVEVPIPVVSAPPIEGTNIVEKLDDIALRNQFPFNLSVLNSETSRVMRVIDDHDTEHHERITDVINQEIRNDVIIDIARTYSTDKEALIKAVNDETESRFIQKTKELGEVLDSSPVMRGLLTNIAHKNNDLNRDYLKSVYKITKNIPVSEKIDSLNKIYTHVTSADLVGDFVKGQEQPELKRRVNQVLDELGTVKKLDDKGYDAQESLSKQIFDNILGSTVGKQIPKIEEFRKASLQQAEYGIKGLATMETLRLAQGQINNLNEKVALQEEEVKILREAMNNIDPEMGEKMKETLKSVENYESLVQQQQQKINQLSEDANRVSELNIEKEFLTSKMKELEAENQKQININNQASQINEQYKQELQKYQESINAVNSELEAFKAQTRTRLGEYEQYTSGMYYEGSNLKTQIAGYENKINELMASNNQLVEDSQKKIQQYETERQNLQQRISGLESDIEKLKGPEIRQQFVNMQTEVTNLNAKLAELNNEKNRLEAEKEELNDKANRMDESGERKDKDIKTERENVTRLKEKNRELNTELEKVRMSLQILDNRKEAALAVHLKGSAAQNKKIEEFEARTREYEAQFEKIQAQQIETRKELEQAQQAVIAQQQQISQGQQQAQQREEALARAQQSIQQLTEEIKLKQSEMEKMQAENSKADSDQISRLKSELSQAKSLLQKNELSRAELDKLKRDTLATNNTNIEKLKQYTAALESKYQRSESLRNTFEKRLEARKQIMDEVDNLSSKFLNGLNYMLSSDYNDSVDNMFQYKDNPKALAESMAGKALIDSWNAMSKFRRQATKDMETIKLQAATIKQYEKQLNLMKQKTHELVNKVSLPGDITSAKVQDPVFTFDYPKILGEQSTIIENTIKQLGARGGRAIQTPQELTQSLSKRQELSRLLAHAINERAGFESTRFGLERQKEVYLEEEAEHAQRGTLNHALSHKYNSLHANIEREMTYATRGMISMEHNINRIKTFVDFYNNTIEGKPTSSGKDLIKQSTVFFQEAKKGSLEAAKTAGRNIMEAYQEAIRVSPGLLYMLPNEQIHSYVTALGTISERLKGSNSEDAIQLQQRIHAEQITLQGVASLSKEKRLELADREHTSAYQKQQELDQYEKTKAGIEDRMLDERAPEIDIEGDEFASFAPDIYEQERMVKRGEALIDRALKRDELTHEEAKELDKYVSVFGINNVGRGIQAELKRNLSEQYTRLLAEPTEAIMAMFSDPKENKAHELLINEGQDLLVKRTLYDLANIMKEHKNDASEEKNALIAKALANKTPAILNAMLEGTAFANWAKTNIKNSVYSGISEDLAKYRLKADSKNVEFNRTVERLASSLSAEASNPEEFMDFVKNVELAISDEKKPRSLGKHMNYLFMSGELENESSLGMGRSAIFGIESDTFHEVARALGATEREDFGHTLKAINQDFSDYANLDTKVFVNAIDKLSSLSRKAVTKKLVDTGHNPHTFTVTKPTTEIKRLYENINSFKNITKTLEGVNYAANASKKKNMATMIRKAAATLVFDTKRALVDIDRLAVRDKTEQPVSIWALRSALVTARGATKKDQNQRAKQALERRTQNKSIAVS
jgi:hypothetical protein